MKGEGWGELDLPDSGDLFLVCCAPRTLKPTRRAPVWCRTTSVIRKSGECRRARIARASRPRRRPSWPDTLVAVWSIVCSVCFARRAERRVGRASSRRLRSRRLPRRKRRRRHKPLRGSSCRRRPRRICCNSRRGASRWRQQTTGAPTTANSVGVGAGPRKAAVPTPSASPRNSVGDRRRGRSPRRRTI